MEICCSTYSGTFFATLNDCTDAGGVQVSLLMCEDPVEDVCCQVGNVFMTLNAQECEKALGVVVADELCEEEEVVCCETPNGLLTLTVSDCDAANGAVVPDELCDDEPVETVCCELPTGPATLTDVECANQGGVPTAPEKLRPV